MQERPVIKTAIPRHRYQVGSYAASLLTEVESGDAHGYRYILAFVPSGEAEPSLYVSAEAALPDERPEGAYRLRVIGELMSEVVDVGDGWGDLETFTDQALRIGAQMLGLQGQKVIQLM